MFVKCQNSELPASNSSGSEPVVFWQSRIENKIRKSSTKKKFLKILLAFRRIKLGRKKWCSYFAYLIMSKIVKLMKKKKEKRRISIIEAKCVRVYDYYEKKRQE